MSKRLIFLIFPIIALSAAFFLYYHSPIVVIGPERDTGFAFQQFDDAVNAGESTCKVIQEKQAISFRYTLEDGFKFPYTGINIMPDSRLDLSYYDYITLHIKSEKGKRVLLTVVTFVDNYSDSTDFNTFRNNESMLNVGPEFREMTIAIKDLFTPDWWYILNSKNEKDFGSIDLQQVSSLNFSNCKVLSTGVEDTITIDKLIIYQSYNPFIIWSSAGLIIYFVIGWVYFFKKRPQIKQLWFDYEKVEASSRYDQELQKVVHYITKHYSNIELSITEVAKEIGIHPKKVAQVIKKNTNLNFKQFLNQVRMTEAKRLLKNTDLQIAEIAHLIGYGNVPHFNRVFRELEGCSPGSFRQKAI